MGVVVLGEVDGELEAESGITGIPVRRSTGRDATVDVPVDAVMQLSSECPVRASAEEDLFCLSCTVNSQRLALPVMSHAVTSESWLTVSNPFVYATNNSLPSST